MFSLRSRVWKRFLAFIPFDDLILLSNSQRFDVEQQLRLDDQ